MKFKVKIAGRERLVEAGELDENNETLVTIDGRERSLRIIPVSHHRINLVIDDINYHYCLARGPRGVWVWSQGRIRLVEPAGEVLRDSADGIRGVKRPKGAYSPTPATVVRILVEEGAHVARGQDLAVVSAMKMETTLTSPAAGVVKHVNCRVGDVIVPGEILIEVESESVQEGASGNA